MARETARRAGRNRSPGVFWRQARLQDTLSDKLLPLFLRAAGELPGTAVENLNRAERLGIIRDTPGMVGAREGCVTGWCTSTSMTSTRSRLPSMSPDDSQPSSSRRLTPFAATRSRGSVYPRGKTRRSDIGRSGTRAHRSKPSPDGAQRDPGTSSRLKGPRYIRHWMARQCGAGLRGASRPPHGTPRCYAADPLLVQVEEERPGAE